MKINEPLDENHARRQIRDCIARGSVRWTNHVLERCSERGLTTGDCVNALKSGAVEPTGWEHGAWRYRVRAGDVTVVVAFRGQRQLTVITAWRGRQVWWTKES